MKRVVIRKSHGAVTPRGMWYADLHCCTTLWTDPNPKRVQYWSFGATLGWVLEHFRRDHRGPIQTGFRLDMKHIEARERQLLNGMTAEEMSHIL